MSSRLAVAENKVSDLHEDINAVGQKVDNSEKSVKGYVNDKISALETRLDRGITWVKWGVGLALPIIFTLVGVLLGKGGT